MRVDQMSAEIAVPGEMKLANPVRGDRLQISQRIEAMIDAADINIVDVEEDGAVRPLRDLAQKFPFVHVGGMKGQIARDIFKQQLPSQRVLYLAHPFYDRGECFFRVGKGQEIVQVASLDS